MRHLKTIGSLLLALMLATALIGCSGASNDAEDAERAPASSTGAAATEQPAEEPVSDPAQQLTEPVDKAEDAAGQANEAQQQLEETNEQLEEPSY